MSSTSDDASTHQVASYVPGSGPRFAREMDRLLRQADLTFGVELGLMRAAGLGAGGTVLDVGSGNGAVTRLLRESLPHARVVALDVDPVLLQLVDEPRLLMRPGQIPLADAEVDDVVVRFVAQHLTPGDRRVLWREIARVLRPGGRIHVIDVDDLDSGTARPAHPAVERVYVKIMRAQAVQGGDRSVIGSVPAELRALGYQRVRRRRSQVSSHERPLRDFGVHVGPDRHVPLVQDGVLSLRDLGVLSAAWLALLDAPEPFISIAVHVVSAEAPPS